MPALPLDEAGKYVAGAYVTLFSFVVLYLSIMASKVARIERELTDLADLSERDKAPGETPDETRDGEPVG